jgi:hypothetical protein
MGVILGVIFTPLIVAVGIKMALDMNRPVKKRWKR